MRNLIRTALVIGTLATPMLSMADPAPAKKDAPAPAATEKKDAPKTDAKATEKKAPAAKKDAKKDAKEPAAK